MFQNKKNADDNARVLWKLQTNYENATGVF